MKNYGLQIEGCHFCASRNLSGWNLFLPARFVWQEAKPEKAPPPAVELPPAAEPKPAAPEAVLNPPTVPEPDPKIEAAPDVPAADTAAREAGKEEVKKGSEQLDENTKGEEKINFGKFIESHKDITKANLEQYVAKYLNITEEEQEKAKKDHTDTKGGFDFQKLATEYLSQREWLIVVSTMSESDVDTLFQKINETDQKLEKKDQMKEDEKKELAEAVRITKIVVPKAKEQLERRHDIEKLSGLMKEGDAAKQKARLDVYKAFLDAKPEDKEAKQKAFLKTFEEKDSALVSKMLTVPHTEEEKDWTKKKLANERLSPNELWEKVQKGQLNFREMESAKRLLTPGDIDGFVKAKKMTPEEAASLKSLIAQEAKAAEAAEANIPAELKGKDFMQVLQLLIDKITALFDKLGTKLDIMFNGPKLKFAASPLGKEADKATDKKFKLAEKYEKGKGVTIEAAANTEVYSVANGKVIEVGGNSTVIAFTLGKTERYIKYSNIDTTGLTKNSKIGQGSPIGKALGNFQLQYFKADYKTADNEEDPTTALTHFLAPSDAEKDAAKKGAEGAGKKGAGTTKTPEITPNKETEKQYETEVTKFLKSIEKEIRFTDAPPFEIPYREGETVTSTPFTIKWDTLNIGTDRYEIILPGSATFASISAESMGAEAKYPGTVKLSDDSSISMEDFLQMMEDIAKNAGADIVKFRLSDNREVEFKKIL